MADPPSGATPAGLLAGGIAFALPEGARPVPAPAAIRPLPGGPPELLGLALEAGRSVLVWALDPAPVAWVLVETAAGPMVLGGAEALATPPPGARRLVPPGLPATPPPNVAVAALDRQAPPAAPAPPAISSHGGRAAEPVPAPARPQMLVLRHDGHAVGVPLAALDGIRPMPPVVSPVPGAPACVLGYAEKADGPVLLLDPAWCAAGEGSPRAATPPALLVVLRQAGRRFGVPCTRAEPGTAGVDLSARLSGTPDGRRALDLAPLAHDAPPRPAATEARRFLLLCRAAGMLFAVAAEEVAAVMPPQRPAPAPSGAGTPIRGVCAHRGEVLPMLDAAERFGAAPTGADVEAPLLRLAPPRSIALAVAQVLGLRSVAADALAPVAGDPLVAALATLDGRPVPVCRAAALAGGASA